MSIHANRSFRDAVLEQVKEIAITHITDAKANVYLFGSWARGEEKRSSDIDIAVEMEQTDPAVIQKTLMNLRDELEESTVPYHVDVVHLNCADEMIRNKVREEGVLWKGQKNG